MASVGHDVGCVRGGKSDLAIRPRESVPSDGIALNRPLPFKGVQKINCGVWPALKSDCDSLRSWKLVVFSEELLKEFVHLYFLFCWRLKHFYLTFFAGEFRPNSHPIVRAEHLSGDLISRLALYLYAKLWACFSTASQDLIEVGVVDPALLCKDRALLRCDVHGRTSYSETLQLVKAFRYRRSDGTGYNVSWTSSH